MVFLNAGYTILYSLMLATVQVLADVEQTCSKREIVEDRKLMGFSYREETGLNRQQCGKECLASSSCRSVNFNKQDLVCEINSNDDTTVLSNEPLWEYISRTDFTKTLPDPCQQAGCINHHQCIVLRSGVHKCLLTECDSPPDVPNALRTSPPLTSVGKSASYTCAPNYRLKSGTGKLMCLPSGMYTNINFECEIQCRNPPTVSNTNAITNNVVNVGATITYTCTTNYRLTGGSGSLQCLSSGVFSDVDFSCQLIQCRDPPTVSNTNAITNNVVNVGATITYTCTTNYRLTGGSGSLQCLSSGVFSEVDFSCQLIECPVPDDRISTSYIKAIPCYTIECIAFYTCPDGTYSSNTYAYVRCNAGGVWDTNLNLFGCG